MSEDEAHQLPSSYQLPITLHIITQYDKQFLIFVHRITSGGFLKKCLDSSLSALIDTS